MTTLSRRGLLALPLAVAAAATLRAAPARAAADPVYTGRFSSLALGGYDAVAYFREGRPVEGSRDHTVEWNGATWRFASADNRAAFEADPEGFAPQYGGYCAWATAEGYRAPGNPDYWRIVDGKLYVNFDGNVQRTWETDIPGFIARADANWPGILAD
ncbi:YHS domain-containing (seleno)protein [Salinarimonas rosea]|uniref:YHS domain-containing (seleno)protein n=1 Tax=Salinarimonas rosea TaxID=552063 RepID=UPI0004268776|nr:YHS domain-containing (seleno)protein [Salinarimonas rosea]